MSGLSHPGCDLVGWDMRVDRISDVNVPDALIEHHHDLIGGSNP